MVNVRGHRMRNIRSFSMNQAVGTVCPSFRSSGSGHRGLPTQATNGPWLDGSHNHRAGSRFRTFGKDPDFVSAAETWVFTDEDYRSINDGGFGQPGYNPARPADSVRRWVDWPGIYHNGACGLAFADGHSEIKSFKSLHYPANSLPSTTVTKAQSRDWEWLAERTSQPVR